MTRGLVTWMAAFTILTGAAYGQEVQRFTSLDGADGDLFGGGGNTAIAGSGSYFVVGARHDDDLGRDAGAAFVFERRRGLWIQAAKLHASDGAAGDNFGFSVAISGSLVAVGAFADDNNRGSVYVFERLLGVWTEVAHLRAGDPDVFDIFGDKVAVLGDTIAVGARGDSSDRGAVYLFTRVPEGWAEYAKLIASDGSSGDSFGSALALGGARLVVGARRDDGTGSAYVFAYGNGAWHQESKLVASDAAFFDFFGVSAAIEGSRILIGAPFKNSFSGAVYVFELAGGAWTETAKLVSSDGLPSLLFGSQAIWTPTGAAIGAPSADDPGSSAGAVYLFTLQGQEWSEVATLVPSFVDTGDGFGDALATGAEVLLVGAPSDAIDGVSAGSVSVFPLHVVNQ